MNKQEIKRILFGWLKINECTTNSTIAACRRLRELSISKGVEIAALINKSTGKIIEIYFGKKIL